MRAQVNASSWNGQYRRPSASSNNLPFVGHLKKTEAKPQANTVQAKRVISPRAEGSCCSLCWTPTEAGSSPVHTSTHPSCLCFSPWRWHRPDALNEELFVPPYASTCNSFLRILPNFALCQLGPHVSTKESLAKGSPWFCILGFSKQNPDAIITGRSNAIYNLILFLGFLQWEINSRTPKKEMHTTEFNVS